MKTRIIFCLVFLVPAVLFSQDERSALLSFSLGPAVSFPIAQSADYFNPTPGVELSGSYRFAAPSFLSVEANVGLNYMPLRTEHAVAALWVGSGVGLHFPLWVTSPYWPGGISATFMAF